MKRDCFTYLFFNWLWIQFLFISIIYAEFDEDTWMDPDAWARHLDTGAFQSINRECCKCADSQTDDLKSRQPIEESTKTTEEDSASIIYFKKFVSMLFNRKNFKYDSAQQHYKRSVVFTISSNQMDKLEQLQDPRDLDNVLIEVFKQIHTTRLNDDGRHKFHIRETLSTIKTIVCNILYDVWQLMKTNEIRFLLVVMIIALIAWIINSRFKIGWLVLVSSGVFIYGYFHTYLECNRELEVTELLEILNSNTETGNNGKEFPFLKFFKGMFHNENAKTLQQQKLKQSAKLSLGFCRPDHVLLMYFNDLSLKYFQVFIEQCSATISSLTSSLGFPYNYLTPVILVCLIGFTLKLIFKYILSPSAWMHLLHRRQIYYQNEDQESRKGLLQSENDRISGENLKLLLKAINVVPEKNVVASTQQNSAGASGVEDIKDSIGSTEKETSSILEKSMSANSQNNRVSKKESLNEEMDLKIMEVSKSL